jgi:Tfp pilus assembly protein PilX
MRQVKNYQNQRGATLIVGLIMLVLITLMVLSAFTMSSSNLKSVGNMQSRDEATAAANVALEQVLSSPTIFNVSVTTPITVGSYEVVVAVPECLYSAPVVDYTSGDQNPNVLNQSGGAGGTVGAPGYRDTYWDLAATVNDGLSGTNVEIHQGVKITLPEDPEPCP